MPTPLGPDTPVIEVLDALPAARAVFLRLGYRCVAERGDDCVVAERDSLAEAARLHHKDLHVLLAELRGLMGTPADGDSGGGAQQQP